MQHPGHVVEFSFAFLIEDKEPVVKEPEMVRFGIDVHASDQADAGNHPVGTAAVLVADQFDAPAARVDAE